MEPDEQQVLYDFLYKDIDICNSLYSQIFKGLLKGSTSEATATQSTKTGAGLSIPTIAKGDFEQLDSNVSRIIESLDPHDVIILETIAKLAPAAKRITDTLARGDIVVATGDLYVFNRPQLDASLDLFEQVMTILPKDTPNRKQLMKNMEPTKAALGLVRGFMNANYPNARYVMFAEGLSFSGMLKESALTSSIESIQFTLAGNP